MTRRLLAASCLAAAVTLGLRLAFPPPPPPGTVVQVAARDLPAGRVLAEGDLVPRRWAGPDAPRSPAPVRDLLGRRLAVPMAGGDVVTPRAVVGPGRLHGMSSRSVAAPLAGVDPLVVSALQPGDHVQVWASGTLVAPDAVVLALDQPGTSALGGATSAGRSVLAALSPGEVRALQQTRRSSPDPAPLDVVALGPARP